MRTPRVVLSLACFLLFVSFVFARPAKPKPITFVGEVIIIGNAVAQDRVIRQALAGINPGTVLRPRQLRIAERKLAGMGIFKVDPARKIRPTVQILQSPGPFRDILVRVEESSRRQWKLESGLNANGQPIVRVIMEDRNFDPFHFPLSCADVIEERAFRGGGLRARIEVMRLDLLQGLLQLFADGSLLPAIARAWLDGMRY
jgi:outer membrane protein assembly factor BamA